MPNQTVRFTKYSFTDSQTDEHFSVDFSQSLDVHEQHIQFVIADLTGFKIRKELINSRFSSVLEMTADDSKLSISRNYENDTITYDPSGEDNPVEWIKTRLDQDLSPDQIKHHFLIYPQDDSSLLQDLVTLLNDPITSQLTPSSDNSSVVSELKDLAGDKGEEIYKKLLELQDLEKQVEMQKSLEDNKKKIVDLESKIESTKSQLAAVDGIVARKDKIAKALAKFGNMSESNLEQEADRLEKEIAYIRQQKLSEIGTSQQTQFRSSTFGKIVSRWKVPPVVPMLVVLVTILSMISFWLTREAGVLMIGFSSAIISFVVWVRAVLSPKLIDLDPAVQNRASEGLSKSTGVKVSDPEISRIERFFVSKAWITALKHEVDRLESQIQESLGDLDYESLKSELNELNNQKDDLQSTIHQIENDSQDLDDYLKLRRKIDMIKIDKARFESDMRKGDNYERVRQILETITKNSKSEPESGLKILGMIEGYDYVRVVDSKLELRNSDTQEWKSVDLDQSQILGMLVELKLRLWESNPILPFVLANVLVKLQDGVKDYINARINQLANSGQLVIINIAL